MMADNRTIRISDPGDHLGYRRARQIADRIPADADARTVLIHLPHATDATTAGLARLVLLRRELLKTGRDLRILGLSARADALYTICRMTALLPRA